MNATVGAQRSGHVSVGCARTGVTSSLRCVWSWPQWSTTRTAPHGDRRQLPGPGQRETYPATRRQEPPLPAVTTGTQVFTLDDESVPVTEERPAALLEPAPQRRVQRHTVEHIIEVLPHVQILDVLLPQVGDQLLEVLRFLDSQVPELAIDVPKIS